MLTHKQSKETRLKARLKTEMEEKRLEYILQNKGSFSLILIVPLSQIYSQLKKKRLVNFKTRGSRPEKASIKIELT